MKIIFLDNDGVICLSNNWGSRFKKYRKWMKENGVDSFLIDGTDKPVDILFDDFDEKSIKVLNQIIEETDAEIVVSSDWRYHANLNDLGDYYISQGIVKRPIDITPKTKDMDIEWEKYGKMDLEQERSLEIEYWLKENKVDEWVAIDDLNMSEYLDNFVLTSKQNEGIKQCGVKEKVIKILKK